MAVLEKKPIPLLLFLLFLLLLLLLSLLLFKKDAVR